MKRNIFVILTILSCLGIMISVSGCATTSKNELSYAFSEPQLENYESGFTYLSKQTLNANEIEQEDRDLYLEDNKNYNVTYKKVCATSSYDDICTMGVNNDILYPGALIDTKESAFRPITIDRAPINLSTNVETSSSSTSIPLSISIDNPSLSRVREGIRSILQSTNNATLAANLSMDIREINSEEEFYLNLGFGLQYNNLEIAEDFKFNQQNKQTNLMIIIKQVYYTVDIDYPGEYGFFADTVTNEDLQQTFPMGSIPAYVASVSYGRIALLSIQTNYSRQDIENTLRASWNKVASFDSTIKSIASDKETSIKCFIYGGETDVSKLAAASISGNTQDILTQALGGSYDAKTNVGLPISYTLRHLNGQLYKIQSSSEYYVKEITYLPSKISFWQSLDTVLSQSNLASKSSLTLDMSGVMASTAEDKYFVDRVIAVPKNITELYLIGPNAYAEQKEIFTNMTIDIRDRVGAATLKLILEDISFSGKNQPAIISEIDSQVEIEMIGDVGLYGAKGCNAIAVNNLKLVNNGITSVSGGNGEQGSNGKSAIQCVTAEIENNGRLTFTGGNGGNGSSAANNYNIDSYASNSDGANGSSGNDGGCGGNGITCSGQLILSGSNNAKFILFGGNGGIGSNGGNGQGTGGGNISTQTKAGNGGNGGKGGNGGNGITCQTLNISDKANFSLTCTEGFGGSGGNGGNGGNTENSGRKDNGGNGGAGGAGGNSGYGLAISVLTGALPNKIELINNIGGTGGNGGTGGYVWWDCSVPTFGGNGGNGGKGGNTNFAASITTNYLNNSITITDNITSTASGGSGASGGLVDKTRDSRGASKKGSNGITGSRGTKYTR